MSDELQALCFLAGANSLFYGEKLLTTSNPTTDHDQQLLGRLGLKLSSIKDEIPATVADVDTVHSTLN
jgi:biotin synthase